MEELPELWLRFRQGHSVPCPRDDGAALALAVEGSSKMYRLVCTECGNSSRWFEPTPEGHLIPHGDGDWDHDD